MVSWTVPSLTTTPSRLSRLSARRASTRNGSEKRYSSQPIMDRMNAGPYATLTPSEEKRRCAVTKVERMRMKERVERRMVKIWNVSWGLSRVR